LGLSGDQVKQFEKIARGLYQLYLDADLALVEINPLIVTDEGKLLALDGKLNVDANAVYRQPVIAQYRDVSQEDAAEVEASKHDLNYVSLGGDIACMVNGAGLAMATMDLIQLHGGSPANFLDVGGGATAARVTAAFKLILSNPNVNAIFVNIFGGIVKCNLIAEGIIEAVKTVGVQVPVVVRLQGTNREQAAQLLAESGLAIVARNDLTEAAQEAVRLAAQHAATASAA
jgi:succinyl-CoA synthetase beta subunit